MKRAQNHAAGDREAGVSVVSGPWSVKMPHLWDGTQDPRLPRWWLVKAFAGCQRPLEALSSGLCQEARLGQGPVAPGEKVKNKTKQVDPKRGFAGDVCACACVQRAVLSDRLGPVTARWSLVALWRQGSGACVSGRHLVLGGDGKQSLDPSRQSLSARGPRALSRQPIARSETSSQRPFPPAPPPGRLEALGRVALLSRADFSCPTRIT